MFVLPAVLSVSTLAATNTSSIVCTAGQCLQGVSNTSIGVTISNPGFPSALLLPGQYTSTTNPQLLHDLLTSSSSSLSPSPGFKNSSASLVLPLSLAQEAGLSIYAGPLYSGQPGFSSLPSAPIGANSSTPLSARSLVPLLQRLDCRQLPLRRQQSRHHLGLHPRRRTTSDQRSELPHPLRHPVHLMLATVLFLRYLHHCRNMHLAPPASPALHARPARRGSSGPVVQHAPAGAPNVMRGSPEVDVA
ncbi:hypothetical protein C8J57DRAFT_689456 [Mycena rebaudengoi]|nr:hypothetical protein C8J57DRAFT_689456 [Mycena rebaudengoi]